MLLEDWKKKISQEQHEKILHINQEHKKPKKIIYWCPENPCAVPLHDLEVGIWCRVGVHKIISPVFLFQTSNE